MNFHVVYNSLSTHKAIIAQLVQWLGYGLDDPGFEARQEENVQIDSGAHPVNGHLGFFPG